MKLYRNVDALLIDDIQFFAKKMRSQEEFFHVFNGLLERSRWCYERQISSRDRWPRKRLQSRFVYGLTVEVEAPDLETDCDPHEESRGRGRSIRARCSFYVGAYSFQRQRTRRCLEEGYCQCKIHG